MVKPDEICTIDRLLAHGPTALSEAELVAAILQKSGAKNAGFAKAIALLKACGGIQGLLTSDHQITKAHGLDRLQSAALLAAIELSRRLARIGVSPKPLDDPEAVACYLMLNYGRINQLVTGAVFLDIHNHRLGDVEVFRGNHRLMTIEPTVILRAAIRHNSSGIVVYTLRPSGDPTPTKDDIRLSERMKEACEWVGLELLDYLVLGGERWTSLRRMRPW